PDLAATVELRTLGPVAYRAQRWRGVGVIHVRLGDGGRQAVHVDRAHRDARLQSERIGGRQGEVKRALACADRSGGQDEVNRAVAAWVGRGIERGPDGDVRG